VYVRKFTRKHKGKAYENYALVESVRTPKGPRQKLICSLGDLSPRPRSEWLRLAQQVTAALEGQPPLPETRDGELDEVLRKVHQRLPRSDGHQGENADLVAVHTDRVSTERPRIAGPVHVGYQFWRRLALDDNLTAVGLSDRARILTCAMVLNRLVQPKSEHAMPDWIRSTALEDILGIELSTLADDALYRNLDRLHPNRVAIEAGLSERERTLFNLDQTVFFYDLTSTYFEGLAMATKRGYSRDKRSDCKQVVIGLTINRDGFPMAHEVFEGNRQDRVSLKDMLDSIDRRTSLQAGQTVVVDRGMAFAENLEQIRSRNLHYIVASRQTERDLWLDEFEDDDGFEEVVREPSPLNPFQKKSRVEIKKRVTDSETHVLCWSEGRTEKDRAIREKQEGRFLTDLSMLEKRIQNGRLVREVAIGEAIGRLKERYSRVARYYSITYDAATKRLTHAVDEAKRGKAERLDGTYLFKTDRKDVSAEEIWRLYMLLTRAEHAFRDLKTPLAERPIFHHLEKRVETHIFLCVLAYHLLVAIEKTLLDKQVHTSWGTIRDGLVTHQVCTTVLPTSTGEGLKIRKGSTPEPEQANLYRLLGVPDEVMSTKKWWCEGRRPG